jgi:hypothetical protein
VDKIGKENYGKYGIIPKGLVKELGRLGVKEEKCNKVADIIALMIHRGISKAYKERMKWICELRDQKTKYNKAMLGIRKKKIDGDGES